MDITINSLKIKSDSNLKIGGSKSETNRMLILQALYPQLKLENISDSDDSKAMMAALNSTVEVIDIHHAGTAMRFLTAYFATQKGRTLILTGSARMKQRPISVLVEALRYLGADISYVEKEGFPPLKITGKELNGPHVSIDANVSSQYITALLLIGARLKNGLEIELNGAVTSAPYIAMTLSVLNEVGIKTDFKDNRISVEPQFTTHNSQFIIESDWSSASYFYSIVALSEIGTSLKLSSYKQDSLQGDRVLAGIYQRFGVETTFIQNEITLRKVSLDPKPYTLDPESPTPHPAPRTLHPAPCTLNLNDTPDLAQTIAVTCLGLGINCHLTGLHTLKIKETDRLAALQNELQKLGGNVTITEDSLTLEALPAINENIAIETYDDHRMAMAFAPLAVKVSITIKNAEVVSKSYPAFWEDLKSIGVIFE